MSYENSTTRQTFGQSGCDCAHFLAAIGLLFYVSNGSTRSTPAVNATLLPDGSVECRMPDSAVGGIRTLTLQTTVISILATPEAPRYVSGYGDADAIRIAALDQIRVARKDNAFPQKVVGAFIANEILTQTLCLFFFEDCTVCQRRTTSHLWAGERSKTADLKAPHLLMHVCREVGSGVYVSA